MTSAGAGTPADGGSGHGVPYGEAHRTVFWGPVCERTVMKRFIPLLLCASLVVPGLLKSESLRLKDGSVLNGRLVKVEQDTLYFETSFGATVAVHRGKVSRIEFDESAVRSSNEPPAFLSIHTSERPGSLSVSFEKFTLTSRVVVPRGGDRESYERENAIELALEVDGQNTYSFVDSTTDKTVRNGPETVLRNDIEPHDFGVAVSPGLYRCVVGFRNSRASAYVERFDPRPLDQKLVFDTVRIEPGKTTYIRVGLKRKAWLVGKTELFKID